MIELLNHIENNLVDLLFKNAANIRTMYIDYHKPYVSRIWFKDEENDCRIYLHKIEPCEESKEALYHPHKWDSAVKIIFGEYEMGVGHSETNEMPLTDCRLFLKKGCSYEMTEKDSWHYVAPKEKTYTLMTIPNKLNGRKLMPVEPQKDFRRLFYNEASDIFYNLREHNKKCNKLDVLTLMGFITDLEENK